MSPLEVIAEVSRPADAWWPYRPFAVSRSNHKSSADAIVNDQSCWQIVAMLHGVVGGRGMPKWSRFAQVAAVEGHHLGVVARLHTKSSSAGPRSSRCTKIFTPLPHPQNTSKSFKLFQSNK
jgi:hypothetical protein